MRKKLRKNSKRRVQRVRPSTLPGLAELAARDQVREPGGETLVIEEVPPELDRTIREVVAWRSIGHARGCLCHNCIPLRTQLEGQLDLVDYYAPRLGAVLGKSTCEHDRSLLTECGPCTALWELAGAPL